jgi:chemotaxis protein methyltransferase CheR
LVVPPELLEKLRCFINEHLGLNFTIDKNKDLERCFANMVTAKNISNPTNYLAELFSSSPTRKVIREIAPYFTVGETYFMREQPVFDALKGRILPSLINRQRKKNHLQIKIWSAGCSSGEEPYSIAILLKEMLPDLRDWRISIIGTDINPSALQKAKSGIYSEWSFRRLDESFKNKYFRAIGKNRYEILPDIRSMVVFSELNLADLDFPAVHNGTYQCDIIMCRNVLYYFSESKRNQILDKLSLCLTEDGWLINSPSESYSKYLNNLQSYFFPGVICYRKSMSKPDYKIAEPLIDRYFVNKALSEPNQPNYTKFNHNKDYSTNVFSQKIYSKQSLPKSAKTVGVNSIPPSQPPLDEVLQQAKVAADIGEYEKAKEICEKVIATDPVNAAAYYLLGVINAEQGQLESAVKLIQQALFLDSNMVLAHIALGNSFSQLGKTDKAKLHFRNAHDLLQRLNEDFVFMLSDMSAGELKLYLQTLQTKIGA